MDGTLTVPGFAKPSEECPPDLLEKEPAAPRLNIIPQRTDLYPAIPDAIMKDLEKGCVKLFIENTTGCLPTIHRLVLTMGIFRTKNKQQNNRD